MADSEFTIRAFEAGDAAAVEELFVRVNRMLAPTGREAAFERYVERSIDEEIGRIAAYYAPERGAGFWVVLIGGALAGFFGLEPSRPGAAELRRMYLTPEHRGRGLGRRLLAEAEARAREIGYRCLDLSTSEIQGAALALYRRSGYVELGEIVATDQSNKTVGGGIRRYEFTKQLGWQPPPRGEERPG